jgi:cytosine/adenosine deaminase-related metal-dependent hydrolase
MRAPQARGFRAVVWCPVSNEFLYGRTADVASLKRETAILFGTDSTLTADWNFWNHLRRARALRMLTDRELFDALTRTAAPVWRRWNAGGLERGHTADLVVARKKAANTWDAFFAVDPEDILLVLRGGVIVLCDASLDVFHPAAFSSIRVGNGAKWVAEDVPTLLAAIRDHGIEPNLPIAAPS